jgi:inorganic phosphate transporter, PiT family
VAAELLIWATVSVALAFDFANGFHDSANSIATIVATRVLRPIQAVSMAAVGNFAGILLGTAVAKTIANDIVQPSVLTTNPVSVVLAALIGALAWDLITWYWGLPTSSSHALIGGLVGAGLAAAGVSAVKGDKVIDKVVIPMVASPVIAFFVAFLFTAVILQMGRKSSRHKVNFWFRKLQIVSSFLYSVSHGTNDAQKTMGIITALLIANGMLATGAGVPLWVMIAAQIAISFGTLFGGWRIVRTMATRITRLEPYQGFGAETGGGLVLIATGQLGFPVSTTHVITGSIMGVGATRRLSAVRWGVTRRIIGAWVLTIPAAAAMGALSFMAVVAAGI